MWGWRGWSDWNPPHLTPRPTLGKQRVTTFSKPQRPVLGTGGSGRGRGDPVQSRKEAECDSGRRVVPATRGCGAAQPGLSGQQKGREASPPPGPSQLPREGTWLVSGRPGQVPALPLALRVTSASPSSQSLSFPTGLKRRRTGGRLSELAALLVGLSIAPWWTNWCMLPSVPRWEPAESPRPSLDRWPWAGRGGTHKSHCQTSEEGKGPKEIWMGQENSQALVLLLNRCVSLCSLSSL